MKFLAGNSLEQGTRLTFGNVSGLNLGSCYW